MTNLYIIQNWKSFFSEKFPTNFIYILLKFLKTSLYFLSASSVIIKCNAIFVPYYLLMIFHILIIFDDSVTRSFMKLHKTVL